MRGSISLAVLLVLSMGPGRAAEPDAATVASSRSGSPLLVEHCHGCHSAKANELRGGLALDSREAILTGGDSGAAVVPGKPEKSLLVSAVHGTKADFQMPPAPKGKLRAEQIAVVETWIRDGAVYPFGVKAAAALDPTAPKPDSFGRSNRFDDSRRRWCKTRSGRSGRSTHTCLPRWSRRNSLRLLQRIAASSSAAQRSI